jgi:predicted O-methyltransferase YrrM
MKWESIDGWFSHGDAVMYGMILDEIPDGGHFLEVGSYKGRSTLCMAQLILARKRDVKIHVVDTFEGDVDTGKGDTYEQFMFNMKGYEHLLGSVNRGLSHYMAKENTQFYDAVYIDALHTYDALSLDIDSWMPYLRLGGMMGGHDYNWSDVHRCVNDRFTEIITMGNSWLVFP